MSNDVRWEPVEQAGRIDRRGGILKVRTTGDGEQYVFAEADDDNPGRIDLPLGVDWRLTLTKRPEAQT